jgi:uncharacterized protein YlxW (UPF0749 family)
VDMAQFGLVGSVAVVLATVIGYLLNANRQDRKQHQEERAELREQLRTFRRDQDEQNAKLNARIDVLEAELETERQRTLAAQSRAAAADLRAERAEYQLTLIQGGGATA